MYMKLKSIYAKPWHVYILECVGGRLYTGIALNVQRRFEQHLAGKGAKYTQSHRALRVVYSERCLNHRRAAGREAKIKKLTREQKNLLVGG